MEVTKDSNGHVRHLHHLHDPYNSGRAPASAQSLAANYLHEVAPVYSIGEEMLSESGEHAHLELAEEKQVMGSTTVSFAETYRGLPIWEAGFSVHLEPNPPRVTSSSSSVHFEVDLDEPEREERGITPENASPEKVADLLGLADEQKKRAGQRGLKINGKRALIYRYEPHLRYDPESQQPHSRLTEDRPLSSGPPTLPLPELPPSIHPGRHYIVTEVLFTLALPIWGSLHWRAFFERNTGAVLYLRAFVACSNGFIFETDPITAAGGPPATGTAAALNARRTLVTLPDLAPQIGGNPVALAGRFVALQDFSAPIDPAPTEPFGHFLFNANTMDFSAVNAYRHVDFLFRLMESMGFVIADYFDDTAFNPGFPLPADHDGFGGIVNAMAPGNSTGTGSGGFVFGRAAIATNVGIADDFRVVAHEFCHALLWDSVHSPNFGFAHSAGDSIGALLSDPGSHAPDRFVTFPWVNIGRRHDRPVGGGWAWGGVNDTGGYNSEQILCTSHFRAYRSTGGDSNELAAARYAARYMVYLIVRAIGSLATTPITPTPTPNVFVTALANADVGTALFDGQPGGCLTKVIRWAFEQQGLFQPPGAPFPVTTKGAPPPVDVYIDDSRHGEYPYRENFWETTEIWNRHDADGLPDHQTPIVGKTNYAYVRIKNRGTLPAAGIVVRGHHTKPSAGMVWPDDWCPMMTASFAVPGVIPPGGQTVAGPFEWKPAFAGHECMLMSVSAAGDRANNDPATFFPCAAGPSPLWRLVPFDNNLGLRGVIPVPGGGGRHELVEAFRHRRFWASNPFDRTVKVEIRAALPNFLATRGWAVNWENAGGASFSLGARDERAMKPRLVGGQNFTAVELMAAGNVAIEMIMLADGLVVGGLTYVLDPKLKETPREFVEEEKKEEKEEHEKLEAHNHNHHHHRDEEEDEEEGKPRRIKFQIDLD